MEIKFTKGEWIFNQEEMKIKGSGDIDGLTVIANVSPKMNYSRGYNTQIANANLISAAPDLLYALDNILKRYEMYCPDEYYKDDAVAEAEDAIKKALGESDSE